MMSLGLLVLVILQVQFSHAYYNPRTIKHTTVKFSTLQPKQPSTKLIKSVVTAPVKFTLGTVRALTDAFYFVSDYLAKENEKKILADTKSELNSIEKPKVSPVVEDIIVATQNLPLKTIEKDVEEIKQEIIDNRPKTFMSVMLSSTRSLIDTYHDLVDKTEPKINARSISSSTKVQAVTRSLDSTTTTTTSTTSVDSMKSPMDTFEELKENYYTTLDNIDANINMMKTMLQNTVQNMENTKDAIIKLPETIELTQQQFTQNIQNFQEDMNEFKENTITTAQTVWKIVTLQAAIESLEKAKMKFERFQKKYFPTSTTATATTTTTAVATTSMSATSTAAAAVATTGSINKSQTSVFASKAVMNTQPLTSTSTSTAAERVTVSSSSTATKQSSSNIDVIGIIKTTYSLTVGTIVTINKVVSWLLKKRKDREVERAVVTTTVMPTTTTAAVKDEVYIAPEKKQLEVILQDKFEPTPFLWDILSTPSPVTETATATVAEEVTTFATTTVENIVTAAATKAVENVVTLASAPIVTEVPVKEESNLQVVNDLYKSSSEMVSETVLTPAKVATPQKITAAPLVSSNMEASTADAVLRTLTAKKAAPVPAEKKVTTKKGFGAQVKKDEKPKKERVSKQTLSQNILKNLN